MNGAKGYSGNVGLPGSQGPRGQDGPKGDKGQKGQEGEHGVAGVPGDSGPPASASGFYVTRHSQSQNPPACPFGYHKMWDGYSLLYVQGIWWYFNSKMILCLPIIAKNSAYAIITLGRSKLSFST